VKDKKYLEAIHNLPCCICEAFGHRQTTPTQAHHTICGRYSQRKTPDRQAIPLCYHHHQGEDGIHQGKRSWVAKYGQDTDYIAGTLDAICGTG